MASISRLSLTPYSKLHKYSSFPVLHVTTLSTSTPRKLQIVCCLSLDRTDEKDFPASTDTTGDLRVMFAAGENGGRIYPAVAIADELRIIEPSIKIVFVGTETGMETTAIPSAGYDFTSLPVFPLLTRPLISLDNLLLPFRLVKSVIESWKKLSDFDPQIVVGTGGYVSFPICFTASLKGIMLVIQEQNSVPGVANWFLSFFANQIFVAFQSSLEHFPKDKCIVSGNPVRLSLRQYVSKSVARSHFFPRAARPSDSEAKVVLVLGGSLGANAINIAFLNMYYQFLLEQKNLFIIWQTGVETFDEMDSLVKNHPRLLLAPFLRKMDLAYAAADLVVSRAGAMTCSEILATGKPSILIPSPNLAEGHQNMNASIMADISGSRIITEDELDSTTLGIAIEEILGDECLMAEMCEKAMKAARPDASAEIAQHILSFVKSPKAKVE